MRVLIGLAATALLTGSAGAVQIVGQEPEPAIAAARAATSERPEATNWALMIAGFATVGLASRRRRGRRVVTA